MNSIIVLVFASIVAGMVSADTDGMTVTTTLGSDFKPTDGLLFARIHFGLLGFDWVEFRVTGDDTELKSGKTFTHVVRRDSLHSFVSVDKIKSVTVQLMSSLNTQPGSGPVKVSKMTFALDGKTYNYCSKNETPIEMGGDRVKLQKC